MYRPPGDLFQKANEYETRQIAYLCEGQLLPAFAGIETDMNERNITAAIMSEAKRIDAEVSLASQESGDLGLKMFVIQRSSKKGKGK